MAKVFYKKAVGMPTSEIANKISPEFRMCWTNSARMKGPKDLVEKTPAYVTAQDKIKMDKGLPLLLITIANYKQTFHPAKINVHTAFMGLMKEVFEYTWNDWKEAKEKISSALSAF